MSVAASVSMEREGAIAFLTLSNPPRLNAMTRAMWRELREVVAAASQDDTLRCIVVRGDAASGGAFLRGWRHLGIPVLPFRYRQPACLP